MAAAELMRLDWNQGKRSASNYRENMALARPLLIEAAKKTPGLQLLRDFPALNLQEIVSIIVFAKKLFPIDVDIDCNFFLFSSLWRSLKLE